MNSAVDHEIRMTDDGSPTVFSKEFNASFHSMNGALQESRHVFIENGLKMIPVTENEVRILEIGFGTGLNALLTLQTTKNKVYYHSIEKYPLQEMIYTQLDFGTGKKEELLRLHSCEWEADIPITDSFYLHKSKADATEISFKDRYDLIYFDAFAPATQRELWKEEFLRKMYEALVPGGILATFCAKGEFKRLLKGIGFTVESPKGAAGKREMTRAIKPF